MHFFGSHFFDSHCHFDFAEFNADRAALWQACNQQGVSRLLIPGVAPEQWPAAAQLCVEYSGLFYAAGIHPYWIEQQQWLQKTADGLPTQKTRAKMIALINDEIVRAGNSSACVAVGECGLDGMIATPLALQQQVLIAHIEVANQLCKPLIVHCVRAHNELIALLKQHKVNYGGVIHAFTGSYEIARTYIDMGFYLGVGGAITYARANKTRAAIKKIPLDFLLLETDAPDMPLQGKQGQRNSPENIPQIAQVLAELREEHLAEIASATWNNTLRLFHAG
ncbi:MAG TPA: TatD family hydrolase [Cellvibrio sp.]|nr:TatD family hydrolase [Cellvibrio sp.]